MGNSNPGNDRFSALIDAAADAILVIDDRGLIKVFNAAAERLFQYSAAEVKGHNVKLLMPEPFHSHHDDYLQRFKRTGVAHIIGTGREVRARKKSGDIFPIDLSVGEIKSESASEFVGIIHDLSERQAAEDQIANQRDQLSHVGRLGTLGEIATGLAHELNQPLTAISTYAAACSRLIGAGNPDNVDILTVLNDISANAKRAGDIIHRLRALVGDDTAEQRLHPMQALVAKSVQLAAPVLRNYNVAILNEINADAGEVFVDDIHIQQIFLNLIKNASEAMTETEGPKQIRITSKRSDNRILVEVADNGPGVEPGSEEDIFQPFFSSKDDGLGVGLSLCKSLILINEGKLSAHNNASGGLSITMDLPLA